MFNIYAEDDEVHTKSPGTTPLVKTRNVGKHVIDPVRVRWRLLRVPQLRIGELLVEAPLGLGLVVDTVKANDALQEDVQLWVGPGVLGHLKQRKEDVFFPVK